jgi:hypothetical protein
VLPDPEVRRFLRYMTGYGMTGLTVRAVHRLPLRRRRQRQIDVPGRDPGHARGLRPDGRARPPDESRGGDRHPTELADLFGARWVSSIEVDEGKRLAETLVKQMTGGDKLKARFMRTDFLPMDADA